MKYYLTETGLALLERGAAQQQRFELSQAKKMKSSPEQKAAIRKGLGSVQAADRGNPGGTPRGRSFGDKRDKALVRVRAGRKEKTDVLAQKTSGEVGSRASKKNVKSLTNFSYDPNRK